MPVPKTNVIKSLTFLPLTRRNQATLDKLHVLMQRFPGVITGMNTLESKFLEYQTISNDESPAYFGEDDKTICTVPNWHQISE